MSTYPPELERFLPIRIVLREEDGRLFGLTEESFSLSTSPERVQIYWSGKAYSILGEHNIDGVEDAQHNANHRGDTVYDPLSDDCPVEINWSYWLTAMAAGSKRKYDARNAPFKLKEKTE